MLWAAGLCDLTPEQEVLETKESRDDLAKAGRPNTSDEA